MPELMEEPGDLVRLEWETDTDVYAAWRNDAESKKAGNKTGPGARNWVVYGSGHGVTWKQLARTYGVQALNNAVRLTVHPDDFHKRRLWPTQRGRRTVLPNAPPPRARRRGRVDVKLV